MKMPVQEWLEFGKHWIISCRWCSDQLCEEGIVIPALQTGRFRVNLYSGKWVESPHLQVLRIHHLRLHFGVASPCPSFWRGFEESLDLGCFLPILNPSKHLNALGLVTTITPPQIWRNMFWYLFYNGYFINREVKWWWVSFSDIEALTKGCILRAENVLVTGEAWAVEAAAAAVMLCWLQGFFSLKKFDPYHHRE